MGRSRFLLVASVVVAAIGCTSTSGLGVEGSAGAGDAGSGGEVGGGGSGGDGGCADCVPDGTCARPFEWAEVSEQGDDGRRSLTAEFHPTDSAVSGTCGGFEGRIVYRYTAPSAGQLWLGLDTTADLAAHVRTSCETAERNDELACVYDTGFTPVKAGQAVFIVLGSYRASASMPYGLATEIVPFRDVGEPCSEFPELGEQCDPGQAACRGGICERAAPPTVDDFRLVRGGPSGQSLIMYVSGKDDLETIKETRLWLLDGQGKKTDDTWLHLWPEYPTKGRFESVSVVREYFDRHPEVVAGSGTVSTWYDFVSESVEATVEWQEVVPAGSPCDREMISNACEPGFACREAGVCESLVSLRQAACSNAPTIEVGGELTGPVAGVGLWDPPPSCLNLANYPSRALLEGVVRLHVDRERRNVRLSSQDEATGKIGTSIAIYEGCGENELASPLACMDHDFRTDPLEIDVLPAGDYLVVMSNRLSRPQGFTLTVEADP